MKADIRPIISDYARSMREPSSKSIAFADVTVFVTLPLFAGVVAGYAGRDIGPGLLTVVSILAGLSFALAVFIFDLRLNASKQFDRTSYVLRSIDALFKRTLYSVAVGVTTAILGGVLQMVESQSLLGRFGTATMATLTIHYLMVLFMCLRGLRAAYNQSTKELNSD